MSTSHFSKALRQSLKVRIKVCQPETQTNILGAIRAWADSTMDTIRVCWLSGPAGTNKTTVAHTIAAEYDERGQLAASFFFLEEDG